LDSSLSRIFTLLVAAPRDVFDRADIKSACGKVNSTFAAKFIFLPANNNRSQFAEDLRLLVSTFVGKQLDQLARSAFRLHASAGLPGSPTIHCRPSGVATTIAATEASRAGYDQTATAELIKLGSSGGGAI
jgi:hypothetical protein